ncbi:hypothetical protein [Streptomyces sp. AM8-1-1]|uniref:hypothetical protein n=1 Tax=Streptomyces sp. AM8-1-1 TaxID=3075825 RepID=UPI0028C406C8|nr:hypothetical protein [Streptomyces sp. AM8-1-1]WNO71690.1 hypothetical protein RPQ07_08600 [Streptomyces sp. AM8-1-1]
MVRPREVYYYDFGADFGLSGLAETLSSRTNLRLDDPVVLALAAKAAEEDEDDQLGKDVRLLLDSSLSDTTIHALWLAAARRCFDPVELGSNVRAWLRRISDVCPPQVRGRDPFEAKVLDAERPVVAEEELRAAVAAEIDRAAAGLERAVAVTGIVAALHQVVAQVDADLGLRMFLRAAKAYSMPIGMVQYDRLMAIGERLAYPAAAVYKDLNVSWAPIDSSWRDFELGRFGLPILAAVFQGPGWPYVGTVRENIENVTTADSGYVPGSYASVLLEDVQRLLHSTLPDDAVTALWRAASGRWNNTDEFDADGRTWLRQIADVCREHLKNVDPTYTPVVSPARTELAQTVLAEVRQMVPNVTDRTEETGAATLRNAVEALQEVVMAVDPDLGFRLFLQMVGACEIAVPEGPRTRYKAIADQLGYSDDHIDERLPPGPA